MAEPEMRSRRTTVAYLSLAVFMASLATFMAYMETCSLAGHGMDWASPIVVVPIVLAVLAAIPWGCAYWAMGEADKRKWGRMFHG